MIFGRMKQTLFVSTVFICILSRNTGELRTVFCYLFVCLVHIVSGSFLVLILYQIIAKTVNVFRWADVIKSYL